MLIKIKIVGVSPLLCNRFTDEAAEAATNGSRGSSAAADRGTPTEQADVKLYRSSAGELVIPQPNILRSLIDGGMFHKIGKKQVTTKAESMLYGALDIEQLEVPIEHTQPWSVDSRAVVNPSTKGRRLCYRPKFFDWSLTFELSVDTSMIGAKLVRLIIDDAGKRIGLGDFRPQRKGPFGRYRVDLWEEIEEALPMKMAA
jgi:hypothetical protein